MFVMRRSEEADGESRMMGSGRFCFGFKAREVPEGIFVADGVDFLDMNEAVSLRTWEKSYSNCLWLACIVN